MSSDSSVNLNASTGNGVYFFSSMLPSLAELKRLATYEPAIFARLEKVQAQRKDLEASAGSDRAALLRTMAEEQMLQQTLDWIRTCDLEKTA